MSVIALVAFVVEILLLVILVLSFRLLLNILFYYKHANIGDVGIIDSAISFLHTLISSKA